ncbi:hypothetical protein GCM10010439_04230 [Actinocorallia aurantiaca]|uniref:Uncharacterized protein n=1 Tax=Actinocorallia aurantiaca TaxID=46204 RepID=A0ABN3TVA7_9ACTN
MPSKRHSSIRVRFCRQALHQAMEDLERVLVLAGTLCLVGEHTEQAVWCLVLALGCVLPAPLWRCGRAVSRVCRDRNDK